MKLNKQLIYEAVASFITDTFPPLYLIIGCEIIIMCLHFTDQEIFGEFKSIFLLCHNYLLFPIVIYPAVAPIYYVLIEDKQKPFWPRIPNDFVGVAGILSLTIMEKNLYYGIIPLLIALFVYVYVFKLCTYGEFVISAILALIPTEIYHRYPENATVFIHYMTIVVPLFAFAYEKISRIDPNNPSKNYHALLVKNYGFVMFDIIYRLMKETTTGLILGFSFSLILNYAGELLTSYRKRLVFVIQKDNTKKAKSSKETKKE